jgi:hypothetical protein
LLSFSWLPSACFYLLLVFGPATGGFSPGGILFIFLVFRFIKTARVKLLIGLQIDEDFEKTALVNIAMVISTADWNNSAAAERFSPRKQLKCKAGNR